MTENSLPAEYSPGPDVQRAGCFHNARSPSAVRPVLLIVEDEAILAEDLKEALQEYGYHVCAIAQTGEEALAEFYEFQPDLVLMDINLPGRLDGIDVAVRITKDFPVPVLYLTAFSDGETITRAMNTNPYGFLVKPFRKETVHSTIQVALARNRLDTIIRGSREWIDLTFRNIDRGLIVMDKEGKIALINSFAERLLGVQFSALHGNAFDKEIRLHDAVFHEHYVLPVRSVLDEGLITIIPSDILLVSGRGMTHRIKEGTISPILDELGSIHGALFVFTPETGLAVDPWSRKTPVEGESAGEDTAYPLREAASLQGMRIQDVKGDIAISLSLEKANLCVLLGKYEEALGIYDLMLRSDPDNFQIWHNLGVVQTRMGRLVEALRSFERALAANPGSEETLRCRTGVQTILSMKRRRD
ncbi:response regulator [Methanoregula sp.]|jgi:DNA-binding response OmpR family regulator|uniref:response regulator n=1 Tax=Methanoregula sp. TaxID=2052170 RepID=UPI003C25D026